MIYQSIEVYGLSLLQRPGVQIVLALVVVSVILAVRMKPHRAPLTPESPHAATNNRPQFVFLGLLALIGLFGFVLGFFAYIALFLRAKAGVAWHRAALAASGAVVVLTILAHFLVLEYPGGLLQSLVELPWPFN